MTGILLNTNKEPRAARVQRFCEDFPKEKNRTTGK
jgi:hypothetical protein